MHCPGISDQRAKGRWQSCVTAKVRISSIINNLDAVFATYHDSFFFSLATSMQRMLKGGKTTAMNYIVKRAVVGFSHI